MKPLMYIFGQPGSGKSTLVRTLTQGQTCLDGRQGGLPVISYYPAEVLEIGVERPDFRGTDALSMTIINTACRVLPDINDTCVLAEGDRLAVQRFLAAAARSFRLELVYLDTPDEVAAERRVQRAIDLNKEPQSGTWVKGRISKARRLYDAWGGLVLDGARTPRELADTLMERTEVGGCFATG